MSWSDITVDSPLIKITCFDGWVFVGTVEFSHLTGCDVATLRGIQFLESLSIEIDEYTNLDWVN